MICDKKKLVRALGDIVSIIPSNSMIPSIQSVKLDVTDKLSLTGSDLETSLNIIIPCESKDNWSCLVQARLFFDIVKSMPEDIELFIENGLLHVNSGKARFTLSILSSEEYPNIEVVQGNVIKISGNILSNLFERTKISCSTDRMGNQAFNAISVKFKDNLITLASTDGQRVSVSKFENNEQNNATFLLYPKTLSAVLKTKPEDLEIHYSDKLIAFISTDSIITSRLVDAVFPEYERIIPKTEYTISCDVKKLYDIANRAFLISREDSKRIKLCFEGEELKVIAESKDVGHFEDSLAIENTHFFNIMVDAKKFLDGLAQIQTQLVIMKTNGANHPILIEEANTDNYLYLMITFKEI